LKNSDYILVFGGTGFIGRVLVWTLLKLKRRCIVVSRKTNYEEVNNSFKEIWGKSSVRFLANEAKKNNFIVINSIDYSQKKYIPFLLEALFKKNRLNGKIKTIINVSGNTSGSSKEIESSILGESKFIISFIQKLIKNGISPKLIHLSSVAAKYPFTLKPPYEKAKQESEEMLKQAGVLDYNVYIGYAKGIGEKKMKAVATKIWTYLTSSFLMCSLKVSVVDVERLALYFLLLAEGLNMRITDNQKKCVDVYISNGTISFGSMIKALLPTELRRQAMLPSQKKKFLELIERVKLLIKGVIIETTNTNDQFLGRMSHFMKLAAGSGYEWFEKKYNNLNFFGLKPNPNHQKVSINKTIKAIYINKKLKIPKIYYDKKRELLFIFNEMSQSKIINFISK